MDLEELLRAARDGKPGAWEALLPSLHRELRRYFLRKFDQSTTLDLTQLTVEILIRDLPGKEPRESLRQWVFGIARNLRRIEHESRAPSKGLRELAASILPNTTPTGGLYAKEVGTILREEIDKLPPHYRAVIENELDGGDIKEFAKRQNISLRTAYSRRGRAMGILRERLPARLEPPQLPADSTSSSSSQPPL